MRIFAVCVALAAFITPPAFAQESSSAPAGCEAPENFAPDDRYLQIAEAYALDALDVAQTNFGVSLDWSDGSIVGVEAMLDVMHQEIGAANPPQDTIETFGKIFGSYVGEVYRRNHGATWGLVTLEGHTFPGLMATRTCTLFWPWGRVQNRLMDGAENNVSHYYQALIENDDE
jgi:hypothetical protein